MKNKIQNLKSKIQTRNVFIIIITLLGFGILSLGFGTSAVASSIVDLTEIGVGARPLGMGKAFNSISDDGSALFVNPAGLSSVKRFNLISMSGNLLNEVPYMVLGGSWKTQFGAMGIGYVGASVGGIKETILVGGTPEVTGSEADYGNTTLIFSYGNDAKNVNYINKIAFLTDRDAKVGANLKLVNYGFSGGSSFEGGDASGFDLDVGTIFPINENLTSSFTIKNIIPGNNVKSDELPMSIISGIAYRMPDRNLLTALDAEISNGLLMHVGCEWNPFPPIYLRGGFDQKPDGINYSLGVGTNFRGFTFDYAYHTYAELSEFTTHFFSLGYIGEEEKPVLPKKVEPPPEPKVEPVKVEPKPIAAPPEKVLSAEELELIERIEKYIKSLEQKLEAAEEPARIEKLKSMIEEQKVRMERIKK